MYSKLINKLNILEPLIDSLAKDDLTIKYTFLCNRIANPDFYAVFLGETSSGKSSIINGLMGETVLPVGAQPTTGVVTEIDINCNDEARYMLTKNAQLHEIDKNQFEQLTLNPSPELSRLVLHKNVKNEALKGIRLFDTPGYGSIVKEHEEVLKEFLPSSDIIIYMVNYRIGIQNDDYQFLRSIKELLRDDIEIVLVLNMCPPDIQSSDRRIVEIKENARNIIGIEPKLFLVERMILDKDSTSFALPKCDRLWNHISSVLNSPARIAKQIEIYNSFILDLYEECKNVAQLRYDTVQMSAEEQDIMIREQEEYAKNIECAINDLISPTFEKVIAEIPNKFDEVERLVVSTIDSTIEKEDRTADQQQMIAFTTSHLLPHHIQHSTKDVINFYISTELDDLNNQVQDLINKETIKFENNIDIKLSSFVGNAGKNLAQNFTKKLFDSGFQSYFGAMGGAAGAGGGVANAASHALKKVGDLFGHKFQLATHNALKHTLSKIGFTSVKAVSAAAIVVTELLFILWDLATWKFKLRNKVKDAVSKWREESYPSAVEDLRKLELENIDNINKIVASIREAIEYPDFKSTSDLYNDVQLANQIGVELYKNN